MATLNPPVKVGIPDYPESTWAAGKSSDAIYDEILRRRDLKRRTGGLLERGDHTLEMLWNERLREESRGPAEKVMAPTAAEQKRIDAAEAAHQAAYQAYQDALQARFEVKRSVDNPSREKTAGRIEAERFLGRSYDVNPSEKPEKLRAFELALAGAESDVDRTFKALNEAQIRLNNVKANIGVRRQKRFEDARGAINAAGFLENLRQYGGKVTDDVKKSMKRHYGRAE